MEQILDLIVQNYLIVTIVAGILVLSLIGYIIEKGSNLDSRIKPKKKVEPENIVEQKEEQK